MRETVGEPRVAEASRPPVSSTAAAAANVSARRSRIGSRLTARPPPAGTPVRGRSPAIAARTGGRSGRAAPSTHTSTTLDRGLVGHVPGEVDQALARSAPPRAVRAIASSRANSWLVSETSVPPRLTAAGDQVEAQVADLQRARPRYAAPPGERAEPGQQLVERERLEQIVVRARIEARRPGR